MARIYLSLIRKGLKTLEDVPEQLREEVRALLEAEAANSAAEPEQEHHDIIIPDELDPEYAVDDDNSAAWVPPEESVDDTDPEDDALAVSEEE